MSRGDACATVSSGGADDSICVDPDAFAPCEGLDDLASCTLELTEGLVNEQCDDASLLSHDACASGCQREALRWEPLTIAVPEAKHSHALAYDSTRDRIVLFGGAGTGTFAVPLPRGDTWESDGVSWTKISTRIAPPARFGHSMAYDPVRRRTVLFGGSSAGTLFDDTWEWD